MNHYELSWKCPRSKRSGRSRLRLRLAQPGIGHRSKPRWHSKSFTLSRSGQNETISIYELLLA